MLHNPRGNKLITQRALLGRLSFPRRKVRACGRKASPAEQDTVKGSHFSFTASRVPSPECTTCVGEQLAEWQPRPRTEGFKQMQIWLTVSGTSSKGLHMSHLDTSLWSLALCVLHAHVPTLNSCSRCPLTMEVRAQFG